VDKRAITRTSFFLLTALLLSTLLTPCAYGQEGETDQVVDTSYFRTGEDDWNLVESVLKAKPDAVMLLLKRGADPNA